MAWGVLSAMRTQLMVVMSLIACGAPAPGGGGNGGGSSGAGGGSGGAGVDLDHEALSGTRLKTQYIQGDDGSRSFLGFFDTQRNEACTFGRAEDGKIRCLPLGSSV